MLVSSAFAGEKVHINLVSLRCTDVASGSSSNKYFMLDNFFTFPATYPRLSHVPLISDQQCDETTLEEIRKLVAQNYGYAIGEAMIHSTDTSKCSSWCQKSVDEKLSATVFVNDITNPNSPVKQISFSSSSSGLVGCHPPGRKTCPF